MESVRGVRRAEVSSHLKRSKVRGQRQPHPPAPPCLLGEEDGGCPVLRGDDELSAPVEGNVSSAEQRKTVRTQTKCRSHRNQSRGDNWLLINHPADPPPLRSARIHGRARRIPHSQAVLKWDDMGFFTSKKTGGTLAFALGETPSCVDPGLGASGGKMQRVLSRFAATTRFLSVCVMVIETCVVTDSSRTPR